MQDIATGEAVKAERTKREWSQQALATKADIALRTLIRIEQGEDCNVSTVAKVATALEVPLASLIDRRAVLAVEHNACPTCTTVGVQTWHDGPCPVDAAVAS